MRKSQLYINGELINTKKTYIRENPATLEPLQEVSLASKKDIENACSSALSAFSVWSKTPPVVRGQILFKVASLIREKIKWDTETSLKAGLKLTYDWIYNEITSGVNNDKFSRKY